MLPEWIVPLLVAAPCVWALWERRRRRAEIGARNWLVEREREGAARLAVEEERARVARELHDIVSHSVSVMVVQAGAARHGVDGEVEEALLAVEQTGREAMTELRHLLGVLAPAPDGDGDAFAPQPSLAHLGTLVDRIAFAGLPVDVTVTGEPRPLPTGIDATGYRIIQEGLTNALKHGTAGATAEVRVSYGTRNLRLEVLNTGPSVLTGNGDAIPPNAPPQNKDGRGLAGLRERVAVYGGDLDARRRLGGGYRVRARIPLERP
ncbi:sensor histidine kinase [Actinomadura rudentiformis]|uniref:histidine kinase n=1 Tax=Actinomadura rudentiformis TaxID=359158 RepID=A0A6H9YQJ6_9ACTN|nr:histidine kinase [Actinomadura rudentiformis]KAB2345173.1 sensor histidine kinase [Actinomadura rudentiformis]